MTNTRAAQEQWDGRTPQDDDLPDEHDFSGEIWLGHQLKAEFSNGSIDALIIMNPDYHVVGFSLGSLIDTAHEKAMELWLEEQADYADDEDGY